MPWWLLLACAGVGDTADTAAEDLVVTLPAAGAHGVGHHLDEVRYADPGLEGDGSERVLPLSIWYPSTEDTTSAEILYQDTFTAQGARDDAAWAAAPTDGFPVVVFSHGHQGYAENSSFLMHHLASHGFVVLAPDHTNNTFFDGSDRTTDIYIQRPRDLSAVLDHALGGALGVELNEETVIALGHSFGGYSLFAAAEGSYDPTVIDACLDGSDTSAFCSTMTSEHAQLLDDGWSEPRVQAWLPMASGDYRLFGADGLTNVDAPVLLMSGDLDPQAGNSDDYQAALPAGEHLRHVRLLGGGHQTFTDFSGILETGDDLLTPEEANPLIQALALAFVRRYGLGDTSVEPVLDGDLTLSPVLEWVD